MAGGQQEAGIDQVCRWSGCQDAAEWHMAAGSFACHDIEVWGYCDRHKRVIIRNGVILADHHGHDFDEMLFSNGSTSHSFVVEDGRLVQYRRVDD
jgi:hypothetical protein